jgi:hypothetical protein
MNRDGTGTQSSGQLAHAERNRVRAAYNYAEFMPERKKMMQAWVDYLEGIKAGVNIVTG